jgi:hypothetical protein
LDKPAACCAQNNDAPHGCFNGLFMEMPVRHPADVSTVAAIEVYPAATLRAYGIPSAGYKKLEQVAQRREILKALCAGCELTEPAPALDLCRLRICLMRPFALWPARISASSGQ